MIELLPTDPPAWDLVIRILQVADPNDRPLLLLDALNDQPEEDRLDFLYSTFGAFIAVIAELASGRPDLTDDIAALRTYGDAR